MRAWLEVHLDILRNNLRVVRQYVGPDVQIMGVLKADAYGHGIEPIAKTLDVEGIDAFAVIDLAEAKRVRTVSNRRVLIMGYLDDVELLEAIRLGFEISLYDTELVGIIGDLASRLNVSARVHVKVETGMNRLGMTSSEAIGLLVSSPSGVEIVGIFSHLSNSDDREEDLRQLARFQPVVDVAKSQGIQVHFTKSHALAQCQEGHFDMVRVGLALYGFEEVIPGLETVMEAKTVIMQRKKLRKGEGVSYSKIFVAPHDMEIAVIAMGYAEGLSLSMSEKLKMLVNGKWARQIGRICMNLSILDVTDIPATRGDEVVVVGEQQGREIRASDLAGWTGIRQHEIVTRLGKSLPKVYVGETIPQSLLS